MRLLIVTQVVDRNDSVLGFFHRWIEEFARSCDQVTVICLKEGEHAFPENVQVHSLGKERRRHTRLGYIFHFLALSYRLRKEYDSVFVHMNPEYVIISGIFWRLTGKKVALWYLHGKVSWRLRLGILFSNRVFTASESSMRVQTAKKRIVGHGVDENIYAFVPEPPAGPFILVSVSRISRIKNIDVLIQAFAQIARVDSSMRLRVVGGPPVGEGSYLRELESLSRELGVEDRVEFVGPRDVQGVSAVLASAHLFLHASVTGSIDKAPLEALSVGVPVLTSNAELARLECPAIMYAHEGFAAFAQGIEQARATVLLRQREIRIEARELIMNRFRLQKLINRILAEYSFIGQSTSMQNPVDSTRAHFNRVASEAIGSSYEQRRWEKNARVKVQYACTESFIRKRVIPRIMTTGRILELGPGPGTWTQLLAHERPQAQFTLTDISSEMLARARAALPPSTKVEIREGEFLAVSLSTDAADTFFSSRALEYIADKELALQKIYSALTAGGTGAVITKTPKKIANKVKRYTPSSLHQGQISPRSLKKIVRIVGFKNIRCYPVTFSVPFLKSARADTALATIGSYFRLAWFLTPFTESYAILFEKP